MKHCLVVDDSNSIRKVARRILEELNFRSSEAATRHEALELCRKEMPDCVIVDWHLPDGDDLAFLTKLRALPGGKQSTIVYMTSERDPDHIAKAMRSGADVHMLKPFDRETFARPFVEAGLV